jgi:FMN phosphatase YigB (HAD superfamily)
VTSVDVGFRKPHHRIFQAALDRAECAPDRCVLVGNSEPLDIQPAVSLGMRSILVAIEDPLPAPSAADAVTTSLEQVRQAVYRIATSR